MRRIAAVTHYTITELIHSKVILYALALFACAHTAGHLLSQLTVGNPLKVLIDFSFLGYQLFIFGFVLFFVVPFYSGAQRLQLFALFLVKPIARWQFLLGTFMGHVAVLIGTCFFFYVANLTLLYYFSGLTLWHLFPAYVAMLVESLFLAALALFSALAFSYTMSYFFIVSIYVLSYTSHHWSTMLYNKGGLHALVGSCAYYLLPDLFFLDIKSFVTYQLPYALMPLLTAVGYTLCFMLLFFIAALLLFENRMIN